MIEGAGEFGARIDRARAGLATVGGDVLLLSVGADLPYLSGYEAMETERLTMFVLSRSGPPTLVVPLLEAPRVTVPGNAFEIRAWHETEDPVAIVAELVPDSARVLIGDPTWSVFLLRLQEAMPDVSFGSASRLMGALRIRKDAAEIDALRSAAAAADRVVDRLDGLGFAGRTEQEISRMIMEWLLDEGHEQASFAIVAAGPNGASPHHEPTDRLVAEGDTVVVDLGGRFHGYCSDTTRTFQVGDTPARVHEVYDVLRAAHQAGMDAVAPGVPAQEIDRACRRVIDDAGWGEFFVHRTGHGIGMQGHEDPYIVEGNGALLEAGMAFSIEPGIYVPGDFGMRLEDIVVVTDAGAEALNRTDRSLHSVE